MSGTEEDMTALEILERCRSGEQEIHDLETSVAMRRAVLARCGEPPKPSDTALETLSTETAAFGSKLERRKRFYSAELRAGVWIVELLPAGQRDVMRGWYLEKKSIGQIAVKTHYSTSSVKRLRAIGRERCRSMDMSDLAGFLPEWYEVGDVDCGGAIPR